MDSEKLKQQMEFSLEIDKVKSIFRQTHLADKSRKENDGEHSWHASVMAVILAEYFPKADLLKTIKMMLFHDIVEIYAGDTYCYDAKGNEDKEQREKDSANKIYSLLPLSQKEELIDLWQEFEKGESEEAKFCAVLDRIQPLMLNYAADGLSWKEHNIKKEQVLERNHIALKESEVIGQYIKDIIEDGYKKGYLN